MAKKKTWRQKLTKACDDLLRVVIRLRDEDTCQWCGKHVEGEDSHPHHIIRRAHSLYLRWDLLNLVLLCKKCHAKYHHRETDGLPWFQAKFPARWTYLDVAKNRLTAWRKGDYERIRDGLRDKRDELKCKKT
jgi:5-methylcytosine-specific restriction endonuclease McrA